MKIVFITVILFLLIYYFAFVLPNGELGQKPMWAELQKILGHPPKKTLENENYAKRD